MAFRDIKRDRLRIVYDLLTELRTEKAPSDLANRTFLTYSKMIKYLRALEQDGCVEMREKQAQISGRSSTKKGSTSMVWIITERGEAKRRLLASVYESEMFKILPMPRS